MLTRREILIGALAAGTVMRNRAIAAQAPPITPVSFDVPAGACDCHVHIHGDPATFPFFAGRVYTPEIALPETLAALHKALHIQRVVIVTPSVYGTDNSATLYGMNARGADARGVAVIDDKTPESALDAMGRAGVCGIRLNLATGGINDPVVGSLRFRVAAKRVSGRSWHVQMNTSLPMIAAMKELFAASPVPVVFDHFGGAQGELGEPQPGFADLLSLVQSGNAYVKISAAYRVSKRPDYGDVAPLAKALIAANPDRILWGTDWPHPNPVTPPGRKPTDVTPMLAIDDGRVMNLLPAWAPDPAIRKKILVENPARLYGFEDAMLARVDHLVYATPDLNAGIDKLETLLGVRATPGGQHPGRGTRNALIALGPATYIEIIGPDPQQPKPDLPRPFGIDALSEPRLVTWAAKDSDLPRLVRQAVDRGLTLGELAPGSRRRPDGLMLTWQYTNPRVVVADGLVPFFIDWGKTPHPAQSAVDGGRLVALSAEHPEPDRIRTALGQVGLALPVQKGPRPALSATISSPRGRVELR